MPPIMFVLDNMGAGPAYASFIIATYSIGQFIAGPFWGGLSDRWGRKPILAISLTGAFVAYLIMAVAKTPEMILFSRAFAGLMAGNIATAYAAIADLTTPQDRAKGMGVLGAAFGLGFVIGPAIGGLLGGATPETANIVYPALASAFFAGLAILAILFVFKETLDEKHRVQVHSKPRVGRLEALKRVAKHPVLIRFCVFIFFVSTTGALMDPVTPLLVGERYHWGPRQMGYIFIVVGLLIAFVQGGLVGRLAKAMGEKNMVRLAFASIITGLGLIIYTPVSYGVVIGLCLTGIGTTLFTTGISALASHRAAPTERGLVMGVVQSMQSLGRSTGPLFAGSLYIVWQGLPYAVGIGLISVAFVWISYLMKTHNIEDASRTH
ncbi:MAG TPA: MFS transporter [Hellea balneolensis]|uniref:MFS transporter n=1 Tax=Hellea balneolensis TaxID=287478 RepID=A0A7C5M1B6_9PROT|nr:MFS transporter [Hellea balneolensis]